MTKYLVPKRIPSIAVIPTPNLIGPVRQWTLRRGGGLGGLGENGDHVAGEAARYEAEEDMDFPGPEGYMPYRGTLFIRANDDVPVTLLDLDICERCNLVRGLNVHEQLPGRYENTTTQASGNTALLVMAQLYLRLEHLSSILVECCPQGG